MLTFQVIKNVYILFSSLPKGPKPEEMETFASDVGTLSDEDVSMAESLTEVQSSTADAPPKIPLTGFNIRDRLLQVHFYVGLVNFKVQK